VKQSRPTVTEAEVSGLLNSLNERYAVLVALVAGTGLRIAEALAVRSEDFDPGSQGAAGTEKRLAQTRANAENSERDSTRRYPGEIDTSSTRIHGRKGWLPLHDASRAGS
jgi:integrase